MQAIHGNAHHHTQLTQAEAAPQTTRPDHGKHAKADRTGSAATTDQIDLSPAAKQFLHASGPGKSGQSPAHQARAMIADHPELADRPFGQIVKALNHGTLDSLIAPAEPDVAEGDVADPVAPGDTTDPVEVVVDETETTDTPAAETDTEVDVPVVTDPVEEFLEVTSDEETAPEGTPIVAPQIVEETDSEVSLLDLLDGEEDESAAEEAA